MCIGKEDMINAYARYYGVSKVEARRSIDRIPDFITRVLAEYGGCSFNGFMKFTRHRAEPRKYYNASKGQFGHTSGGAMKINCKISPVMKELVENAASQKGE